MRCSASARVSICPRSRPRTCGSVRKNGKQEHYVAKKYVRSYGISGIEYRSADNDRPWNGTGVEAILLKRDDHEIRMERVPEQQREQGAYREFVSNDGWTMTEYESGPTGIPSSFRVGRFIANLVLNALHFVLWFLCLWLLMRFLWAHAFVGAVVLWLVTTLTVLPMLLSYAAASCAGERAAKPQAASGRIVAAGVERVAAADAPDAHAASLERAVFVDGEHEVFAAARMETADLGQHRTDHDLIKAHRHQEDKDRQCPHRALERAQHHTFSLARNAGPARARGSAALAANPRAAARRANAGSTPGRGRPASPRVRAETLHDTVGAGDCGGLPGQPCATPTARAGNTRGRSAARRR